MALVPCSNLSAATWISDSDLPWDQLVTCGPAGLPAYARLRFIPDPVHEGQSEADVVLDVEAPSEAHQLRIALDTLLGYTSTPDDCYFCLWDGWYSDLYGSEPAGRKPGFPRSVLDGPKIVVPHRAFFLFRGPLSDFGDWGTTEQARVHLPHPSFVWPADRAWCLTKDVDPHWAGIGADTSAIRQLTADDRLDVVPVDPSDHVPHYL